MRFNPGIKGYYHATMHKCTVHELKSLKADKIMSNRTRALTLDAQLKPPLPRSTNSIWIPLDIGNLEEEQSIFSFTKKEPKNQPRILF